MNERTLRQEMKLVRHQISRLKECCPWYIESYQKFHGKLPEAKDMTDSCWIKLYIKNDTEESQLCSKLSQEYGDTLKILKFEKESFHRLVITPDYYQKHK